MTENINAFNTMVSQLVSVDIKLAEEDKSITLLCTFLDSSHNLVVAIGSTTQSSLNIIWLYQLVAPLNMH
jgi:hypothetical protein